MTEISLHQFASTSDLGLNSFVRGSGALQPTGRTLRFVNYATSKKYYTNAQIDDYQGLPRRHLLWQPPLQLVVRARFSHPEGVLSGTAGFGFWNDPFMMTGWRWPTLPQAVWFFYASPPSNMKLDAETSGCGWKAATIDAWHWPFFALAPLAPIVIPLMRVPSLYRRCWPLGQKAIRVSEQHISTPMTAWQTYELTWQRDSVQFTVNSKVILHCTTVPGGPLGLVIWFDNQYMIVTPWGKFGYGLLAETETQWMEIDYLTVT